MIRFLKRAGWGLLAVYLGILFFLAAPMGWQWAMWYLER